MGFPRRIVLPFELFSSEEITTVWLAVDGTPPTGAPVAVSRARHEGSDDDEITIVASRRRRPTRDLQ